LNPSLDIIRAAGLAYVVDIWSFKTRMGDVKDHIVDAYI
jgi:hypothetical protein